MKTQLPLYQRGAAALLISTVLLFAVSLVTLFTSRNVLMEQKISANQNRASQALESAQAGVDFAISYMRVGGADHDGDGNIDPIAVTDPSGLMSALPTVWVCNYALDADNSGTADTTNCDCSTAGNTQADASNLEICSRGASDDGTGSRLIRSRIDGIPLLSNGTSHPIVSRTSVNTNGEAKVHNTETNATIWTGAEVSKTNNKFLTFISDGAGSEVGVSNGSANIGFDVIDQDPALAALTGDQFFQSFFTGTKAEIKATADKISTNDNDILPGKFIWADGNLTIGSDVGTATSAPAIVVVEGNLRVTGNTDIYGIIYVMGSVDVVGTTKIYGSLIGEGAGGANLDIKGTPDIYYKRYFGAGNTTVPTRGVRVDTASWRDF